MKVSVSSFDHWWTPGGKANNVICGISTECLIIESTINELIHDRRIPKWLRYWLADFHKVALTYTPDHISGECPVYIVVPLYSRQSYSFADDVVENILFDTYKFIEMIIYYPHFEHCDIAELQMLFSALQYLVREALLSGVDMVEPSLQEFNCNAEYIVFNIAFPSIWHEDCPFRKLVLDYAPEVLVRYMDNILKNNMG